MINYQTCVMQHTALGHLDLVSSLRDYHHLICTAVNMHVERVYHQAMIWENLSDWHQANRLGLAA